MGVRLRGHHLLCLLGFRGMGYSADFAANMSRVYNHLRKEPETNIIITEGPDDLCAYYPAGIHCHCQNQSVTENDQLVLQRLGLQLDESLPWSHVLERVKSSLIPEDIGDLCSNCQWRTYGVCEAGIRTIRQGKSLPPLPDKVP